MAKNKEGKVAKVVMIDDDAVGNMTVRVERAPGGKNANVNIIADWCYDRCLFYTADEVGMKHFGNPDGAMDSCTIIITAAGSGVKLSIDYGENGASDDFWPLSHQLGTKLLEDVAKELAKVAGAAAARSTMCS
jgi:hypothetical protein